MIMKISNSTSTKTSKRKRIYIWIPLEVIENDGVWNDLTEARDEVQFCG